MLFVDSLLFLVGQNDTSTSQKRKAAALVITIPGLLQIACAGYEIFFRPAMK